MCVCVDGYLLNNAVWQSAEENQSEIRIVKKRSGLKSFSP